MSRPALLVMGRTVRPLERIAVAGELLGLPSRTTAYRMAKRDGWPLVGPPTSCFVSMVPLLQMYGIPFTVVDGQAEEAVEGEPSRRHA